MLMQYLTPEERKGENKYKHGEWVLYDDRPTQEQQQMLIERARNKGLTLRRCKVCGSFMEDSQSAYCSQRCINDIYMERRRARHEMELRKVCVLCGQSFVAKRKDAKYCSQACKQASYRKRNVTDNRSAKFGGTDKSNEE